MKTTDAKKVVKQAFLRTGYIRWRDPKKLSRQTRQAYKKGYEIRFPVESRAEQRALVAALRALDIEPGRPFQKHSRIVVPVYGKDQVERILEFTGGWEYF